MTGLCGWVGDAEPSTLARMLARIGHRGDRVDQALLPGAALGYRFWSERPGHAAAIVRRGPRTIACAGELAPSVACPAEVILDCLERGDPTDNALDGSFLAAVWDEDDASLRVVGDPFGTRSLYWVEHRGAVYFASELKQLLAIPGLPVEVDPSVIHNYLTFSFVAGDRTPIRGVHRVPPGHVSELRGGAWIDRPYLRLTERVDRTIDDDAAAAMIDSLGRAAVEARLPSAGRERVGLYLSGGLDSSTIACWLGELGLRPPAYSLDFGERSVEREQAALVAESLGLSLSWVDASPEAVLPILRDLAWRMDLPLGDGVTGPHYLLAAAASRDGLTAVFNGEGGDQLFGGWNNKPMIAAEVFTPAPTLRSRAQAQLQTYHRFGGLEDELLSEDFAAAIAAEREARGDHDERLELLERELGSPTIETFLGHLRQADIAIKGCDNIQPRAERIAGSFGLDVRSPLFDRALTEASFTLHPRHKLRGVVEKFALKRAVTGRLPDEIVWRRKSGMCVPTSQWMLGPMRDLAHDLLGPEAAARRGMFRADYLTRLRNDRDHSSELRPRRVGEKLWALAMLELWLRAFVDGRGQRPDHAGEENFG